MRTVLGTAARVAGSAGVVLGGGIGLAAAQSALQSSPAGATIPWNDTCETWSYTNGARLELCGGESTVKAAVYSGPQALYGDTTLTYGNGTVVENSGYGTFGPNNYQATGVFTYNADNEQFCVKFSQNGNVVARDCDVTP